MCREVEEYLKNTKFIKFRSTPHISEDEGSVHEEEINTLFPDPTPDPSLGLFKGPKMYTNVWFCLPEFKPY